ncbi:MMPL family transporter [Christiangramia sabulilitoris]|uniref:MMPL family transporter n=1 Tax=Christiangramia sabulilitoris TaxID=2583991 RepID=A0A550I618_9FLAO|nr:MMPL family transporter [Christiangramia sabulilitoris]TRO66424.1 MMPL family transporter [Christiangramia sabulilitoris]
MQNFFHNIHTYLKNHKIAGLFLVLAYTIIVSFLAWNIELEEDITKLIPAGEKQQLIKRILEETDFSDKIIVSISAGQEMQSPDLLVAYANEFTQILDQDFSDVILEVKGKVPEKDIRQVYNFVYNNLPLFLEQENYDLITNRLKEDSISSRLGSAYRQLMSPTGFVTKDYILKDPLGFANLGLARLQELQVGDNFSIYKNYLITRDQKNIILFLDPAYPASETAKNEVFINNLDNTIAALNKKFSEVEGSYFGGVLYSLANANRIKKDIRLTMGIALSLLLLLLIFFYRKIYVPLLLFLPSLLSGITALAILSVIRGSVSAISLGIGAILLGVTLDYALHILTHYRNNRNVEDLFRDITKPVLMSSVTTAMAFLCLIFVGSEALNELGIFSALSVLLSSVFALVIIPLSYNPPEKGAEKETFLDRIAAIDYSKIKPLLFLILAVFIISLFYFDKVQFNSDLDKINYQPLEVKELENRIEELAGRDGKSIYMVAYGNSVDEALQQNNKLYRDLLDYKEEGIINNFSSIGGVISSTSTQTNKIENWDSFWTAPKKDSLQASLIDISSKYGFRPETFSEFYNLLDKDFETIGLNDYKKAGSFYLNDFISEGEGFATVTSTVNLPESKAEEFTGKFVNIPGVFALDRKALNQSFLGNLKDDFNKLILTSILAVFLVLIISYRSLEISLFTLLPIAVTWICALGIMAMLNIEFNILNIIISTFIFGLGLDYSIFITNASLYEYETGEFKLKTYQSSILISVLTTLLGMGALIFAGHPALRSISIVSIIGVITAVAVSFVIQRAIFRRLIINRVKEGNVPFHFKELLDFKGRITNTESEKLYRTRAVLNNYRYKSVYSEVKKSFRHNREKNVRISRYIEEGESVAVINAGYGLLALYLSYKIKDVEISAYTTDNMDYELARGTSRTKNSKLTFYNELNKLPVAKTYIINHNPEDLNMVKELVKKHGEKVILVDSSVSYRWLLDLNFEIIYRQNKMMVLKKLD